jgi:galactokinase
MTADALAATLVASGLDPAELPAKRSLFNSVVVAFAEHTGRCEPPRYASWVPGRLEVFGKHTDYAGGRSLVCAVPRGLIFTASPRSDGTLRVFDAGRGESMTLEPLDPAGTAVTSARPARSHQFTGWRHYVEVVASRLARNFPGAAIGSDVAFASDLPRAAGMSSSSALVVGLTAALVRVSRIDERPEWRTNVHSRLDAAGYYACMENGLSFGTLDGDAGVGTHGGSEDHAAIIAGQTGHLSGFAFMPMRHISSVRVPGDWRFVLAPSGVRSEKTGAAQDLYNRLARGARLLLELWNSAELPCASLGAVLASSASAGARLRDLVRRSAIPGWPPEALEKRLEHFTREDARVPEAVEAFQEADRSRLTLSAEQSQADAETLLGNQVPATIALARAAREHGAFAACSFGAGFGGSVWALADRAAAGDFATRWHPGAFVAQPGPPLTEF